MGWGRVGQGTLGRAGGNVHFSIREHRAENSLLHKTCRPFWYVVWYSPIGQLDTLHGNDYVKVYQQKFLG